ncbi:MAG: EVE domain-containing protein [Phycisphaerae bacterium]
MARWLIKADPHEYGARELERDRRTRWDGVSNALALRHIRAMRPGDELLLYHTADEKAVVARARVASVGCPDPTDPAGKRAVVDVEFVGWLATPIPLASLRGDPAFASFDLLRNSRLSVMPIPNAIWDRLVGATGHAGSAAGGSSRPTESGADAPTPARAGTLGRRRSGATRRPRHESPSVSRKR